MSSSHPIVPTNQHDLKLPIPPPPIHPRSTNDMYDGQPGTPTQGIFTSPPLTPHGSPSKHHMPPGAYDLPNIFDNAMKLVPTNGNSGSPTKAPGSPSRSGIEIAEDNFGDFPTESVVAAPGSPTRKANKENTPPAGGRPSPKKESSFINQAAASRQEVYKTREAAETSRPQFQTQRGLSAQELELLQKQSVKRLTGVTQLCK